MMNLAYGSRDMSKEEIDVALFRLAQLMAQEHPTDDHEHEHEVRRTVCTT